MKTMITAVILATAAAVDAQTPEEELAAALPGIFARCEAHARELLDGMGKADPARTRQPISFVRGHVDTCDAYDWCSGFFPGTLWYLFERTGNEFWKTAATDFTERLIEPLRHDANNHDVGFRTYCSAGNALRLTGDARYADFLHDTAAALRTRYSDRMGLIRSWDGPTVRTWKIFDPQYIVIIDNMMNLELLEWDAKNGGAAKSDEIARNQADSTDRHHFRPDGSAYHILSYATNHPDRITGIYSGQGGNVEGTWSRGQAWAIYGFAVMYRETGTPRYLARAERAAEYWLTERNLPEDGIPYWDFTAIGEERDASAGAITASAFLELSTLVKDPIRAARYRAAAVRMLLALAGPGYFAAPGEAGGFMLKHSVATKPTGAGIDISINYADYYFLEGLVRFGRLKGVK